MRRVRARRLKRSRAGSHAGEFGESNPRKVNPTTLKRGETKTNIQGGPYIRIHPFSP
jgi:hypothetical protein